MARQIRAIVSDLAAQGITVFLTTHYMEEANQLCDRVAILDRGRIVALDTPDGLKQMINRNGHEPTLEDVFMQLTGKELIEKDDLADFELEKVLA